MLKEKLSTDAHQLTGWLMRLLDKMRDKTLRRRVLVLATVLFFGFYLGISITLYLMQN